MLDLVDLLSYLDETPEIESGNEGIIYGNYLDWDRIRQEHENDILNYLGVDLPWGKSLNLDEYLIIISQDVFKKTNILEDYLKDSLLIDEVNDYLYDIKVHFTEREDNCADDLVSDIFEFYEIPFSTHYEKDLPEKLRYWESEFDKEYDFNIYSKYPINVEDYGHKINALFDKIDCSEDQTIKTSLILSSLILTESMFKSVIVRKIKQMPKIDEKNLLQDQVNKRLRRGHNERKKLFKEYYKVEAPVQYWIDLRNSLAHDIDSVSLNNNDICYFNYNKGRKEHYIIQDLKNHLFDFWNNIKSIIDQC